MLGWKLKASPPARTIREALRKSFNREDRTLQRVIIRNNEVLVVWEVDVTPIFEGYKESINLLAEAKNPYAERILRDIYFLKRFEKWNGNDVDFCLRLLANFEADNKTGEGTGPRWAVSYDEHLKEIDSILLSLIKGYHHNS